MKIIRLSIAFAVINVFSGTASAQSAEVISATYCEQCKPSDMLEHAMEIAPDTYCSVNMYEGESKIVCEGESKAVIVSNPKTEYSRKFFFSFDCDGTRCTRSRWVKHTNLSEDEQEAAMRFYRFYRFYQDYKNVLSAWIYSAGESGIVPVDRDELQEREIYTDSCIMGEQNPVNYLTDAEIRKNLHQKIVDMFQRELTDQRSIKLTVLENATENETPKFGFTNQDGTVGLLYEKSPSTFADYFRYDFGFNNDTSINFRVFLGGLNSDPIISEFNSVSLGFEFDWATSQLEGLPYRHLFQDVQPFSFEPGKVPPCLEELFDPNFDHYENLGPTGIEQTIAVDGVELQMCEISRAAKACAPNGIDSSCRRIKIKSYVPCDEID